VPVGNAGEIPDVLVGHQNRLAARFSTSTGSSRFPRGSAARGLRWPRPRISKGPARIGSSARGRSRLLNNARKSPQSYFSLMVDDGSASLRCGRCEWCSRRGLRWRALPVSCWRLPIIHP
jgi:hypothetical protein